MYQMEKNEEDQIIEGKVDPQEWKREVERVYRDLDNIERDIQLIRTRGAQGDEVEQVEECRRHIELIIDLCKDIRETCHYEVRKVFATAAESLEDDLGFIRRHEVRIN